MRRRFMRRFIGIAVLALVAMVVTFVALAWFVSTLLGQQVITAALPVVAFVIALLIAARLVRGLWREAAPLGDLIEASSRVEAGEVGTQVRVSGPPEVRSLARAFNAMSARLAEDSEERRHLLADVSHELRTPLSVIRGNLEGMIDGLYPADRGHLELVLAEARQMEQLVEDLRTLSLADAGALQLHREVVDLPALAGEAVAAFRAGAEEAGVALGLAAEAVPPISADPRRMRQVLANLLSNAVRHTPSGGRVDVSLAREDDAILLEVTDTGEGMDAAAVERAFDRFWRAGDRSGAGLGLAIVRDLVEAHGGEVKLESHPGQGTRVTCRLSMR